MSGMEWKEIRARLAELSNLPERIIELRSVFNILKHLVTGLGNNSIAELTGLDVKIIRDISIEYLGLDRDGDVCYNPLKLFNANIIDALTLDDIIVIMKYLGILEELENYERPSTTT